MFPKTLCAVVAICTAALSHSAMADHPYGSMQPENYAGAGLSYVNFSNSFIDGDLSLAGIHAKAGKFLNKYISYEIRGLLGLSDDSVSSDNGLTDYSLDYAVASYIRASIPTSNIFKPYFMLGGAYTVVTAENSTAKFTDSEIDLSYGLGTDISLHHKLDLNVELVRYYDRSDTAIDAFSVALISRF